MLHAAVSETKNSPNRLSAHAKSAPGRLWAGNQVGLRPQNAPHSSLRPLRPSQSLMVQRKCACGGSPRPRRRVRRMQSQT